MSAIASCTLLVPISFQRDTGRHNRQPKGVRAGRDDGLTPANDQGCCVSSLLHLSIEFSHAGRCSDATRTLLQRAMFSQGGSGDSQGNHIERQGQNTLTHLLTQRHGKEAQPPKFFTWLFRSRREDVVSVKAKNAKMQKVAPTSFTMGRIARNDPSPR